MIRLQAKTKGKVNEPSKLDQGKNPSNGGVSGLVYLDRTLTDSGSAAPDASTNDREKQASNDGIFRSNKVDPALTDPISEPPFVRPVLMRPDEICDIKFAMHYCNKDDKTIRRWVKKHGIGRQAGRGAPIEISKVGLEMVLQGDFPALDLLRSGERTHPDVIIYFKWLLLPA